MAHPTGVHRFCFPALLFLASCSVSPAPEAPRSTERLPPRTSADAPPAPAPASSSVEPSSGSQSGEPIRFIADDFEGALALAKKQDKALFVDAWAAWCHTCLSMKHDVFVDPSLAKMASTMVFLEIDTDRAQNAEFVERYQINVWPTFFVLEPSGGEIVGMWMGSASASELVAFMEEGARDVDELRAARLPSDSPTAALVRARQEQTKGRLDVAAREYESAIEKAGPSWSRRSEALMGLIAVKSGARQRADCLEIGRKHLAEIHGAALPSDFGSIYLGCIETKEDVRLHGPGILAHFEKLTSAPSSDMAPDDLAEAFRVLSDVRRATGDAAGARAAQERRLSVLEEAARKAVSPAAAQTYDWGRVNTLIALGRPENAIALLVEREALLPSSYDPPSRLSSIFASLGRLPEALAAIERAIAKAYDLRRLEFLSRKAELLARAGDVKEQSATLEVVVTGYEALPSTVAIRRRLDRERQRLTEARARLR